MGGGAASQSSGADRKPQSDAGGDVALSSQLSTFFASSSMSKLSLWHNGLSLQAHSQLPRSISRYLNVNATYTGVARAVRI